VLLSASGDDLTVTLKAPPGEETKGEVWLCPLVSAIKVAIGRGENRGRTVVYHNVVRAWHKLGEFAGKDVTWSVPLSDIESGKINAAAVMVQEGTQKKPGVVLGAAFAPLQSQLIGETSQTTSSQ
jgi:hypothetical protein